MKLVNTFLATMWLVSMPLSADEKQAHWDYDGEDGPDHWGELAAEFDICSRGRNQSPVDLVPDMNADLPTIHFDYTNPGRLNEVNTGHAIQENVLSGNHVDIKGVEYELKQFHFHSPSEHTIDGATRPMEVHFVHQRDNGDLLVIGLMFVLGEHNELMDDLPSFRRERGLDPLEEPLDYNRFVMGRGDYYRYNGSLTTPPCSEGVYWVVMKTPIEVSERQIRHFHDMLGFDNNRPIQPKNARVILE